MTNHRSVRGSPTERLIFALSLFGTGLLISIFQEKGPLGMKQQCQLQGVR